MQRNDDMAHPGGRPTKYTDEMPELLFNSMAAGKSVVRFCSDINIAPATFYLWLSVHKEFSETFAICSNKCEAFWEEWLVENLGNKDMNSVLIKMFFTNRFGWSDKKEQNISVTTKEEIPRAIRQAEDGIK